MKNQYPTSPDWPKARKGSSAGPDCRPRLPVNATGWSYGMSCNIVLPAPGTDVLYLDGNVYEILAPGTSIFRHKSETLVWRGLYQARKVIDQPAGS